MSNDCANAYCINIKLKVKAFQILLFFVIDKFTDKEGINGKFVPQCIFIITRLDVTMQLIQQMTSLKVGDLGQYSVRIQKQGPWNCWLDLDWNSEFVKLRVCVINSSFAMSYPDISSHLVRTTNWIRSHSNAVLLLAWVRK